MEYGKNLSTAARLCTAALSALLISASAVAQHPEKRDPASPPSPGSAGTSSPASSLARLKPMGGGASIPVFGSGTTGRLAVWQGLTSTNSFLGDTVIFQDKGGKVGIGTDSPSSPLTVAGMIETTLGGYKFPDGTIQSTALSAGDVVSSLNGLKGNVILASGPHLLIQRFGQELLFNTSDLLSTVAHDSTLAGFGTSTVPLRVAVPLVLTGASGSNSTTMEVTNSLGGTGITVTGGVAVGFLVGGSAVRAKGGNGPLPGAGVVAFGGDTTDSNFVSGDGVLAFPGAADAGAGNKNGLAGRFIGDVFIGGDLSVGGNKNFKIDHPLDPENKCLVHAALESSEVLNVYSGNVVLGPSGDAIVTLPKWFEALNRDFRYQLTAIGAPALGLYIAEEIHGNQFRIAGGAAGAKVSWQVTGVRSDARSLQHPFHAEEDKPDRERGTYLAPEAFGQPEEKGFAWSRYPQLMQERKETRLKMSESTQKTRDDNR